MSPLSGHAYEEAPSTADQAGTRQHSREKEDVSGEASTLDQDSLAFGDGASASAQGASTDPTDLTNRIVLPLINMLLEQAGQWLFGQLLQEVSPYTAALEQGKT